MAIPDTSPRCPMTPDQALELLRQGNRHYLHGSSIRPHLPEPERRSALAHGQQPFCVVVGCSDSRVPPELLFNQGLGELFIVRNAGNCVDLAAMGSIGRMIEPIIPAVLRAPRDGDDDLLDRSMRVNVQRIVERLRTTGQMLTKPQREGRLRIVGARYDLDDATVQFFE